MYLERNPVAKLLKIIDLLNVCYVPFLPPRSDLAILNFTSAS
jgi:hypothetical protein